MKEDDSQALVAPSSNVWELEYQSVLLYLFFNNTKLKYLLYYSYANIQISNSNMYINHFH